MEDRIIYDAIEMLEKKTKLQATWETNAEAPFKLTGMYIGMEPSP